MYNEKTTSWSSIYPSMEENMLQTKTSEISDRTWRLKSKVHIYKRINILWNVSLRWKVNWWFCGHFLVYEDSLLPIFDFMEDNIFPYSHHMLPKASSLGALVHRERYTCFVKMHHKDRLPYIICWQSDFTTLGPLNHSNFEFIHMGLIILAIMNSLLDILA